MYDIVQHGGVVSALRLLYSPPAVLALHQTRGASGTLRTLASSSLTHILPAKTAAKEAIQQQIRRSTDHARPATT